MSHNSQIDTHPTYRHHEVWANPKLIWLNNNFIKPSDFNWSVVELLRHQMELAHSTQYLHQSTTNELDSITKSFSLQEKLTFYSQHPIFKTKELQSFNKWLYQIYKVTSITNNDPYKLALGKSQGPFSKTISSCIHIHLH